MNSQRLKRFISRVLFYGLKFIIIFPGYVNSRIYMKYYEKLLRSYGMNFTGTPRFIASNVRFDDMDLITLGDRCAISENVRFLTHDYSLTTALIHHDGAPPPNDIALVRPITIGNNVFIGLNTIILPNTVVGDNVIIGSGSVVRGTIPSDSIVIGNPAKVIKSLSTQATKWKINLDGLPIRND